MPCFYRLIYKNRWKFIYFNCFLIFLLIIYLIINQKSNHQYKDDNQEIINRIQNIPILDQKYEFIITYQINIDDQPKWIYQYKLSYLFNFYWLQTGGYKWHLQQMIDMKSNTRSKTIDFHHRNHAWNDFYQHPEYGVIIDTALDPFQPIFSPLPGTSSSLHEVCIYLNISKSWYPCYTKSEMISSFFHYKPLITYGLYNVIIGESLSERIHYDEIIYLFDNQLKQFNETYFIKQILPRLIRLLALVPQTAVILSPYLNLKIKYINQYIDLLNQYGILNDKKRLIKYNDKKTYHAYVVYSTQSPRSDLILLHHILMGNHSQISRELILIIRHNLDNKTFDEIIQTINQFQQSDHLQIHEYNEQSYNIKYISQLFRQAIMVIGMPSHTLSQIVWCLPGTHIIEFGQKIMTTDYYEISLQLKFNYWLGLITATNRIDIIDFRNLIMKIFTEIS